MIVSLGRAQIASLAATVADFSSLVLLVEICRVWYVVATAIGALVGAVVNFFLGRQWSFMADHESVRVQAVRYAAVSGGSLLLNSSGVYLFTHYLSIHYTLSKAITALLVGVLFNFPLHRRFVFGRRSYA